tara:strand:- start:11 stop:355 length:345 start_codon:yes stop_codon:yes gene_type:complete
LLKEKVASKKGRVMISGYTLKQGDENFENTLDMLEKKYHWSGGDSDAEVIVNWNKREIKEDGVVSFYATNSAISNAIKRCRKGIKSVEVFSDGVTLFFHSNFVRPMHTVLKVSK